MSDLRLDIHIFLDITRLLGIGGILIIGRVLIIGGILVICRVLIICRVLVVRYILIIVRLLHIVRILLDIRVLNICRVIDNRRVIRQSLSLRGNATSSVDIHVDVNIHIDVRVVLGLRGGRRITVARCRLPHRDVDSRVVAALLLLLPLLRAWSGLVPLWRHLSGWALGPVEHRIQDLDPDVDLLRLLGLRRRSSGTARRTLDGLARWALLLLSRWHLLLRGTHLLTWRRLWPRLQLRRWLAETYLGLTLDLDLTLHLGLALHLCRSGLHMGKMRPLLLLHRRSLLPLHLTLLGRWRWLLTLRLGSTRPCGVKNLAPDRGTRSSVDTKGLGNEGPANRKSRLLHRILFEEIGRFTEPVLLAACRCLGRASGWCLPSLLLLLLLLNDLRIGLYRQGR